MMEFYSCLLGFIAGILVGMLLAISSYIDKAKSGKDFTYIDDEVKWVKRKEISLDYSREMAELWETYKREQKIK